MNYDDNAIIMEFIKYLLSRRGGSRDGKDWPLGPREDILLKLYKKTQHPCIWEKHHFESQGAAVAFLKCHSQTCVIYTGTRSSVTNYKLK